jgi:hypothetical protein
VCFELRYLSARPERQGRSLFGQERFDGVAPVVAVGCDQRLRHVESMRYITSTLSKKVNQSMDTFVLQFSLTVQIADIYRKKENKTWVSRVHHFPRLPFTPFCTHFFPSDGELRTNKYNGLGRSGCRARARTNLHQLVGSRFVTGVLCRARTQNAFLNREPSSL